jgi:hypothetical protein
VIISVQYNFLYDLHTHLQDEKEQADWSWLICVSFDVIYVCVILHFKRHACVIISVQYNFYNFLYDLPTHLQAEQQADGGWLIRVSFDVICLWFRISYP